MKSAERKDVKVVSCKNKKPEQYADKIILAPMVRANSLPFRLLCLRYGADLVYTEELIDYKLCECKRIENKALGTHDYVDEKGEVILRTRPEEREQLILQIGSNNADRAIKATKLVRPDIVGLDFNFGCPKSFSLSGGMGAALLEKPDQIKDLLTRCVTELDIPVTCKIRLLPDVDKTISLVKMIESCGVSAVAIHGRTKEQRPHHENQDNIIKTIAQAVSVPIIANGGSNWIKSYSDVLKFKEKTGSSSVMIARSAMRNPSIFRSDNQLDSGEVVIKEFIKLCVKSDNSIPNTKYSAQAMLKASYFGGDFIQRFHSTYDYKTICDLFQLADWYDKNKLSEYKSKFYDVDAIEGEESNELEKFFADKLATLKLDQKFKLVSDTISYIPRIYGQLTPKSQLMNHSNKKAPSERPKFHLIEYKQHRYYCFIQYQDKVYLNKTFTGNKKLAEQATALLICDELGFINLDEYRTRTKSSDRVA